MDKLCVGRRRSGRDGSPGRAARPWTAAGALLGAVSARAGLPDVADPSTGAVADGDFIGMLQAYGLDIVVLGGLGLSAIALLVVAKNVISKYSMVADGRATWGEVGMHGAVGVVLLVIVIFLATQAATVLT
ncbi:MAG: TIGR03745 family integrating conjugative element membrane protein [Gammaproteobacteria bacterium]|nr:TIGR03745 family integrating conjugative element membrane protein [Gammaproteobacteria bacterium]